MPDTMWWVSIAIRKAKTIAQSGAIHCITHSVAVEDPLVISHLPLQDTEDTENSYVVVADVGHRSGLDNVTLHWATSPDGPWNEVAMSASANTSPLAEYAGAIPAQTAGTKVHYYVHAEATSGKTGARPMPAPEGWWSFRVLGNVDGLDSPEALTVACALPQPCQGHHVPGVRAPHLDLMHSHADQRDGPTSRPCIKALWLGERSVSSSTLPPWLQAPTS